MAKKSSEADASKKKVVKKTATVKKSVTAKKAKPAKAALAIVRNDPWLEPFAEAIEGRHADALRKEAELTSACLSLIHI